MHVLRRVIGTRREALQDWILPVDWLEYGKEEIKLSVKSPWWGGTVYVRWGRVVTIHVEYKGTGRRCSSSDE